MNVITQTSIWKNTLDSNSEYSQNFKEEVDLLRTTFWQARKNASAIAENIKDSQQGLTIHDITHLDALWETLDLITKNTIVLNPIEAFVLGCSILFHDLGMALYVWEKKGIEEIKKSLEFKDLAFDFIQQEIGHRPSNKDLTNISDEHLKILLAIYFREHHADKAKDLPLQKWTSITNEIFVIENYDLREKLGIKIGIIAQSHWWGVGNLTSGFTENISPSPTGFPLEWKIDNIKIACLLRISDFIQIDDRRAPSLQYALFNGHEFSKISKLHWLFQNKLNRVTIAEELLIFETKHPFKENDSDSWWLAYNIIKDIDKEIKQVNDLLHVSSKIKLNCSGVKGIDNPISFSDFLKTEDWSPVNTQYKVSDILNIIQKFGGEQLYGNRQDVPIRELIQNSADAINAKKNLLVNFHDEIIITFYQDEEGYEFLEIKDNGIGMTKNVMLNYLLDFGKSYWKSDLVRKDYKGLISSQFRPTGNYGIGFFSVFMIATDITVKSKSILNPNLVNILNFKNGLKSNPIFKQENEIWFESGTSIKLKLIKNSYLENESFVTRVLKTMAITINFSEKIKSLAYLCNQIAPALTTNLSVQYFNEEKINVCQANDWEKIDNLSLLKKVYSIEEEGVNRNGILEYIKFISKYLTPIISDSDKLILARATLIRKENFPQNLFKGVVSVGGFKENYINLLTGIWIGENKVLSRNLAIPICSYSELFIWLESQHKLLLENLSDFTNRDLYDTGSLFYSMGYKSRVLPIAFTAEKFLTYEDILKLKDVDHFLIRPVIRDEENIFSPLSDIIYSKMSFYEPNLIPEYYSEGLWKKEINQQLSEDGLSANFLPYHKSVLGFTLLAICKLWDTTFSEVDKVSFLELTKWHPIMNVYKDKQGNFIEDTVLIIVNPKKTTKKEIAIKYETEIKKWIEISESQDFDISKFYQ